MDSAFLHVMADAVSSVGAIIASLCIMYFSWYWADPVVSALVVVMVAFSAIRLLKKSSHIILQGVPEQYDLAQIRKDILAIPDVKDLHDLHLWGLGAGKMILTAHIITSIEKFEVVLHEVKDMLLSKYDIHHSTIQMEFNDDCKEDCGIDH